jgi:HD-GYP domain-containing protein (c-di-GMP phosphodiesterase class II)
LAKIVAFADCFDLLMFEEGVNKRRSFYRVIEKMASQRQGKLCPEVSETFIRRSNDLMIGGAVQLSDGTMGRVVYINPLNPTRPVLQVGPDYFIDLSKETELHIASILNEFTDVVKPI